MFCVHRCLFYSWWCAFLCVCLHSKCAMLSLCGICVLCWYGASALCAFGLCVCSFVCMFGIECVFGTVCLWSAAAGALLMCWVCAVSCTGRLRDEDQYLLRHSSPGLEQDSPHGLLLAHLDCQDREELQRTLHRLENENRWAHLHNHTWCWDMSCANHNYQNNFSFMICVNSISWNNSWYDARVVQNSFLAVS